MDVTDRCLWVSLQADHCEAELYKWNPGGQTYIDLHTGRVASEVVSGPPGTLVVELRENASPAVRAIWDEMIASGTHNIADLPSWQPIVRSTDGV